MQPERINNLFFTDNVKEDLTVTLQSQQEMEKQINNLVQELKEKHFIIQELEKQKDDNLTQNNQLFQTIENLEKDLQRLKENLSIKQECIHQLEMQKLGIMTQTEKLQKQLDEEQQYYEKELNEIKQFQQVYSDQKHEFNEQIQFLEKNQAQCELEINNLMEKNHFLSPNDNKLQKIISEQENNPQDFNGFELSAKNSVQNSTNNLQFQNFEEMSSFQKLQFNIQKNSDNNNASLVSPFKLYDNSFKKNTVNQQSWQNLIQDKNAFSFNVLQEKKLNQNQKINHQDYNSQNQNNSNSQEELKINNKINQLTSIMNLSKNKYTEINNNDKQEINKELDQKLNLNSNQNLEFLSVNDISFSQNSKNLSNSGTNIYQDENINTINFQYNKKIQGGNSANFQQEINNQTKKQISSQPSSPYNGKRSTLKINESLPSEICLSKDLRNTQNLKNFYNDGVKISFLSQSKTIISLEIVDMLVPENQKIRELNKKWIKIKKNNQRPFISPLNQDSLVSIWHAQSPLKLMIWDIFSEKINNFSFTFQESFIQKFEIISIIPFTKSENEFDDFKILVFGNGDQMPFYAFISVTQQGEYYDIQKDIYELNYFEEEWNLLDIQYYDEENSVVIWERNTIEGNYIDIFDLLQQKVIFTQKIQDDQSQDCFEINKVTSLDGKYIIGYDPNFQENIEDNTEKNQQECENNNQIKRQIPYTLTFLQYDQYINNDNQMQYDNQIKKLNQTK
ncbi:hypothetical protein PPERSA_01511 [Pseudocohnilembus persalinus]|uniref:Uncharacterized protein n=1 Tax=Pseudocohnilembus persalinus TaxID=266149 RepID=A0A0V0R7P9_PSEPJ|nr:hypothetical protein PPERSA_01511 [Pseudocohnilembus persalinus]|eukprot:KRX10499.1 hypothetical protein PPERSA_01511 [Pseudocohnilembus persalinus]